MGYWFLWWKVGSALQLARALWRMNVGVMMPGHGQCGSAQRRLEFPKHSHGSAANRHASATS